MMLKVGVAIPWRRTESRVYAHAIVRERYETLLESYGPRIIDVDTDDTAFNLAAARNEGVRLLGDVHGVDVVVLADADTLPEQVPLKSAIWDCLETGMVHLPYTEYRSLREDGTAQYLAGARLRECNHLKINGAVSGVLVTTPDTWEAIGGQDERFRGWGYEDAAFAHAHKLITGGELQRHKGHVYALHHESAPDKGSSLTAANLELCMRYLACKTPGDLEAVGGGYESLVFVGPPVTPPEQLGAPET